MGASVLDMLQGKKAKSVEDDSIDEGELKDSGIDIQRGDSRLQGGITRSNLTPQERQKLDENAGSI